MLRALRSTLSLYVRTAETVKMAVVCDNSLVVSVFSFGCISGRLQLYLLFAILCNFGNHEYPLELIPSYALRMPKHPCGQIFL
jgi:hypothetical protein